MNPFGIWLGTVCWGSIFFGNAMACWPGGDYNPLMRMLSALGRTEVRLVDHPLCHYLFTAGMVVCAVGIAALGRRLKLNRWGVALTVVGLLVIAAIPENVTMIGHNAGCWLAAFGGAVMLFAWARTPNCRAARFWLAALILPCLALALGLGLHAAGVIPFAPWVPTAQKVLILAFMFWLLHLSLPFVGNRLKVGWIVNIVCMVAFLSLGMTLFGASSERTGTSVFTVAQPAQPHQPVRFSSDEQAALNWLECVTGKLPPEEEKKWWNHGARQFSIFSLRYNIAFAAYAAAALGGRVAGTDETDVRARVGRVLANCLERYLAPEVWGYSQAKSYWGEKPWAPDPCYRENIMYTGHLLQILALYELFTGDTRYWTEGFDFVWKGKKVHYTVQRLIDVTVYQMRKGPNGGIPCEPGLIFFSCNNHPHVALKLFSKLGHGDWSVDAHRWEKWALEHFRSPLFGGGAVNLVYHVKTGLFYPRGSSGMDGWSVLWYEPWAENRATALSIWHDAIDEIDWEKLEQQEDSLPRGDCNDPEPAPASLVAVFLSAAARACDDVHLAERLEKIVDSRALVRKGGLYYLDLNVRWKVGATAQRIIALAESHGFRFRNMLNCDIITPVRKGHP